MKFEIKPPVGIDSIGSCKRTEAQTGNRINVLQVPEWTRFTVLHLFPFIYQGIFLPFFAFLYMLLELLKVSFILKIFLIEFKDKTSDVVTCILKNILLRDSISCNV